MPKKFQICRYCKERATTEIRVWERLNGHLELETKPTCRRHGVPQGKNYTPELKDYQVYKVDASKFPGYSTWQPRFQYEVWRGNIHWYDWYKQSDAISSARNEQAISDHFRKQ